MFKTNLPYDELELLYLNGTNHSHNHRPFLPVGI